MNPKPFPILIAVLIAAAAILTLFSLMASTSPPVSEAASIAVTDSSARPTIKMLHPSPDMPESPTLCGEAVPMDAFGVRESLDRELVVNAYHHSSTILYLKRAGRWFPVIEPILEAEGVPDDMKYLAVIESGLAQVVSSAGASGFWQFMKKTAPAYGLEVNEEVDERYHVAEATRAACAYLKQAYNKFGTWSLAAASYNMGMGGVERELREQGVDSYWDLHLNAETARYVYRLLAVKELFENPLRYGFDMNPEDLYAPYITKAIVVDQTIPDLASFAREQGTTLKVLKALNPWLRDDFLPISAGNSYRIDLPA